MNIRTLIGVAALVAALSGCESGDINIDAENNSQTDNSTDNSVDGDNNVVGGGGSTPGGTNPCASYTISGTTRQGTYSAPNCTYGSDFVDLTNPITTTEVQVTFSDLANDGVHIFAGSLVVGRSYNTDAELLDAGISEGGDGAAIRIDAGATLAFRSSEDYMVINRGSQIFAEGEMDAPITITSVSDAVNGTVDPEDVSEWGGLIINGFGVTNKCAYTGNRGEAGFSTSECHVVAEGKSGSAETYYGGANDDDNSGVLEYFVVKHTGAQVAPDNELNGVSFDAVGRGTTISYLQAYSTYDDGIEMFGGAVNIDHYVAVYVRDDSIDIDEGYIGTIDHALVIQSETDGQQCLESDGLGSYDGLTSQAAAEKIAQGLNSAATLNNVTCIISPVATGTHDAPGAGLRIREGHFAKVNNSLITTAYQADAIPDDTDENQCLRIDNPETLQGAEDGEVAITNSIFACQDLTKGGPLPDTTTLLAWLQAGNDVVQTAEAGEDPTAASNANLIILDGFYSLPIADVVINGGTATITPDGTDYVGAVTAADDWTMGWTYGLHDGMRGEPLWFEAE